MRRELTPLAARCRGCGRVPEDVRFAAALAWICFHDPELPVGEHVYVSVDVARAVAGELRIEIRAAAERNDEAELALLVAEWGRLSYVASLVEG